MKKSIQQNGKMEKQKRKKSPGFTLVEIIAVLAIIGVLTAALLPSIKTAMNRSEDTQKISTLSMLDSAAKIYEMEHGTKPADIDTLKTGGYVPKKDYTGFEVDAQNGGFKVKMSSGNTLSSKDLEKYEKESGT